MISSAKFSELQQLNIGRHKLITLVPKTEPSKILSEIPDLKLIRKTVWSLLFLKNRTLNNKLFKHEGREMRHNLIGKRGRSNLKKKHLGVASLTHHENLWFYQKEQKIP